MTKIVLFFFGSRAMRKFQLARVYQVESANEIIYHKSDKSETNNFPARLSCQTCRIKCVSYILLCLYSIVYIFTTPICALITRRDTRSYVCFGAHSETSKYIDDCKSTPYVLKFNPSSTIHVHELIPRIHSERVSAKLRAQRTRAGTTT